MKRTVPTIRQAGRMPVEIGDTIQAIDTGFTAKVEDVFDGTQAFGFILGWDQDGRHRVQAFTGNEFEKHWRVIR